MAYDEKYYQDKKSKKINQYVQKLEATIDTLINVLNQFITDKQNLVGEIKEIEMTILENSAKKEAAPEGEKKDVKPGIDSGDQGGKPKEVTEGAAV